MIRIPEIHQEAPNLIRLTTGNVIIWYSYSEMIAFQWTGGPRFVSENVWSNTTGKHLNTLADKKNRIERKDFLRIWNEGPSDAIDNLATMALSGDAQARDAILDTLNKGG